MNTEKTSHDGRMDAAPAISCMQDQITAMVQAA